MSPSCQRCQSRQLPDASEAWGIVVAGVGGTGVITIGSLLGMAAHLEGKAVITQDCRRFGAKRRRHMEPYPDCQYTQRHPHHQSRYRQSRSGAGL